MKFLNAYIKSLPTNNRSYLIPLIIVLLSLSTLLFDNYLQQYLVYHREKFANFQYWQIITTHFFHTNLNHFILNVTAVALLWLLHGHYYNQSNYLLVFVISALFCTIGIHFLSNEIHVYVGLSGVLHGLFVWGALKDIEVKEKTGYFLLLGIILKIIHEQVYGANADLENIIAATVAIDAHLYGALGGLVSYFGCRFIKI